MSHIGYERIPLQSSHYHLISLWITNAKQQIHLLEKQKISKKSFMQTWPFDVKHCFKWSQTNPSHVKELQFHFPWMKNDLPLSVSIIISKIIVCDWSLQLIFSFKWHLELINYLATNDKHQWSLVENDRWIFSP